MYILGISAYYHDSAAVLLKDGKVIAAIEEERFTRVKHDNGFPVMSVKWCLKDARISIDAVDTVAYYEKPLLKFERTLDMFVATWPKGLVPFVQSMPELLGDKLSVEDTIRRELRFSGKIIYVPHHLSHAAASYFTSPFASSAILTVDGVGEYQTTAIWSAKGTRISLLEDIHFPHSLGLFYSTCAAYLGFKVNEDEYKLMGLAAYGKPSYLNSLKKIITVGSDGGFRLDMSYFSFREGERMWSKKFEDLFGQSRLSHEPIKTRHRDFAKSVQSLTESIYLLMLEHAYSLTGSNNICIGGGVALNALANGRIHDETSFANAHVFGPSGDSGAAMGAALYAYHSYRPEKRTGKQTLSLGTGYTNSSIEPILKKAGLPYRKLSDLELISHAAISLQKGKVIGWFQGRCEFGPRALGNRSILCAPSPRSMKTNVNRIKIREQFRPFAGSILRDKIGEYFMVPPGKNDFPFMNYCFSVKKDKRKELAAIVHADGTCRIQTVTKNDGLYYRLIKKYEELTDTPCVLDTSFNLKGEPIVESPLQAIADFCKTKMDVLYIGNFEIIK